MKARAPQARTRRKKRKVNYKVYLIPPVPPEDQCPHTTQPMSRELCSQCLGVEARRPVIESLLS